MSETTNFWRGSFGDEYSKRNRGEDIIKSNEALFRRALAPVHWAAPRRIIEFGANIGLNLRALQRIASYAETEMTGVEVNDSALAELKDVPRVRTLHASILDPSRPWGDGYDLSMAKGILIHIQPDDLPAAYDALYHSSKRFVFLAEYHNPTPVEVLYRGEKGRLWKRDFAAEMLDRFPDLHISWYGFAWSRDPHAPQDDLVVTLMEREQIIKPKR